MDKEYLHACRKSTSNIASTSDGCVSEEPNRSEESFQTNEVIIRGGQFPNAHFGPQEIQNVYIDQRTIVSSHPKDNVSEENSEEFLHRVKLHVTKQTQHVSDIDSHPKTILLDMDGSKTVSSSTKNCETEVLFGRDVADIRMSDFHDKVNGKPTRHVMILGEAGAGKSTLSQTYCIAVQKGHLKTLQCIEMVMFVNAFDLLSDSPSKIFDLFFTHQMAGDPDTELSSELQDAGLQWIQKNSHKMLVIIDGLDQYSSGIGGKRYPKIASDAHAYPDTIIANLMSGNIWPKTLILTTSRWSVYWGLMAPQKPDKVVGLRGFDDLNMEKAAQNLLPESSDSMLSYIRNAAPKLLALCQNPMFLSYTSKVFQTSFADLPDSVSSLLAAVFSDFIHSCHLDDPDLDSVTKLAFCGMMENRFEFSVNYLKKHKIDPAKLEGFLASGAFLKPGQKEAKRQDKKYAFSHQSMQVWSRKVLSATQTGELIYHVDKQITESKFGMFKTS